MIIRTGTVTIETQYGEQISIEGADQPISITDNVMYRQCVVSPNSYNGCGYDIAVNHEHVYPPEERFDEFDGPDEEVADANEDAVEDAVEPEREPTAEERMIADIRTRGFMKEEELEHLKGLGLAKSVKINGYGEGLWGAVFGDEIELYDDDHSYGKIVHVALMNHSISFPHPTWGMVLICKTNGKNRPKIDERATREFWGRLAEYFEHFRNKQEAKGDGCDAEVCEGGCDQADG